MADNLPITPGSGATVATDDVGGIHYQLVKQAWGDLNVANLVSAANPLPVSATITGVATETTLAGLTAKFGALGQATMAASAPVTIASNQGALAVTGAFYQATQPVSGTVTVGNASVAVTGSFYQATQPVSIASMPSTPVTGTFFQATQPVSIAATVAISAASLPLPSGAATAAKQPALGTAGAASTDVITVQGIASGTAQPVTGTFWQATQPVSGTITANAGTGTMAVSLATLPALTTGAAVIGAVTQSGTWNIGTVTTLPALPANQSVNNAQVAGVTTATGSGVVGTGVQRVVLATDVALPAGTNTLGTTTGPTLTKATQGTTGYSVQDLKDAGRVSFAAATVIAGVAAVAVEALLSVVPVRDGTAAAGATSITVTSGKRLRVQAIVASARSSAATVLSGRVVLRMNPSGAVTATSPIIAILSMTQQAAALAEAGDTCVVSLPDGFEISGTQQIGLSQVCSGTGGVIYASIVGFEY